MKFSIKNFFSKCDQITFTEEILNGKLHFLCGYTLLFLWPASDFLVHFYSCLFTAVPSPEIYFLQIYLNWFFIIWHEVLYTYVSIHLKKCQNFQTKNKFKELVLAKISGILQISYVI